MDAVECHRSLDLLDFRRLSEAKKQLKIKENRTKNTYERNQKIFEAQRRARIMPIQDTAECDEE